MNRYEKEMFEGSAKIQQGLKLTIVIIVALIALCIACIYAFAGEKYQTYRKIRCEWCRKPGTMFNKLDVHHFYNQAYHPKWKNVEMNTVTLHHRCQFVFHKCNFTNQVPESCVLFGRTTNDILNACITETGSITGKE